MHYNESMKKISKATLQRYPVYLKALRKIKKDGIDRIMSSELSNYVNIKSTTIRRDFSLMGTLGKQGYGYDVDRLIETFTAELGGNFSERIVLIGCGNLGKALLNYNNWDDVVGEIVCAFDKYPEKVGKLSVTVFDIKDLEKIAENNLNCHIAILTATEDVQETVDRLAAIGINAIVDFTHQHINTPDGVTIKTVDVVSTIQELVFEANRLEDRE